MEPLNTKPTSIFPIPTEVLTYLWVVGFSMWGGAVNYFARKEAFSLPRFLIRLLSSSFAGMMAYFACDAAGVTGPLVGLASGVAGHMGTPALIRLGMRLKVVRSLFEDKEKK